MLNIGVVGYSDKKFDEDSAKALLATALNRIEKNHKSKEYALVSGLTDIGIPALAYRMAVENGWKTIGIACSKAKDMKCFNVDETIIVGDEWGDESETFLKKIDCLIRVGGGKQSKAETKQSKKWDFLCMSMN